MVSQIGVVQSDLVNRMERIEWLLINSNIFIQLRNFYLIIKRHYLINNNSLSLPSAPDWMAFIQINPHPLPTTLLGSNSNSQELFHRFIDGRGASTEMEKQPGKSRKIKLISKGKVRNYLKNIVYSKKNSKPMQSNIIQNVDSNQKSNSDTLSLQNRFRNNFLNKISHNWIQCSICLEQLYYPALVKCGHVFCLECIERHVDMNNRCPLCRQNLEDDSDYCIRLSFSIFQIVQSYRLWNQNWIVGDSKKIWKESRFITNVVQNQKYDIWNLERQKWQTAVIVQITDLPNQKKQALISYDYKITPDVIQIPSIRIAKFRHFTKAPITFTLQPFPVNTRAIRLSTHYDDIAQFNQDSDDSLIERRDQIALRTSQIFGSPDYQLFLSNSRRRLRSIQDVIRMQQRQAINQPFSPAEFLQNPGEIYLQPNMLENQMNERQITIIENSIAGAYSVEVDDRIQQNLGQQQEQEVSEAEIRQDQT